MQLHAEVKVRGRLERKPDPCRAYFANRSCWAIPYREKLFMSIHIRYCQWFLLFLQSQSHYPPKVCTSGLQLLQAHYKRIIYNLVSIFVYTTHDVTILNYCLSPGSRFYCVHNPVCTQTAYKITSNKIPIGFACTPFVDPKFFWSVGCNCKRGKTLSCHLELHICWEPQSFYACCVAPPLSSH